MRTRPRMLPLLAALSLVLVTPTAAAASTASGHPGGAGAAGVRPRRRFRQHGRPRRRAVRHRGRRWAADADRSGHGGHLRGGRLPASADRAGRRCHRRRLPPRHRVRPGHAGLPGGRREPRRGHLPDRRSTHLHGRGGPRHLVAPAPAGHRLRGAGRPGSSPWRPTAAGSWSPTDTTTACSSWCSTAPCTRWSSSPTSSRPGSTCAGPHGLAGRSRPGAGTGRRTGRPSRSPGRRRPRCGRWRRAPRCSSTSSSAAVGACSVWPRGSSPSASPRATPATEGTGQLRVADDGHFRLVVDHLDRPTSLEFIGDTAYVVTLGGEVWRIPDVCG